MTVTSVMVQAFSDRKKPDRGSKTGSVQNWSSSKQANRAGREQKKPKKQYN